MLKLCLHHRDLLVSQHGLNVLSGWGNTSRKEVPLGYPASEDGGWRWRDQRPSDSDASSGIRPTKTPKRAVVFTSLRSFPYKSMAQSPVLGHPCQLPR